MRGGVGKDDLGWGGKGRERGKKKVSFFFPSSSQQKKKMEKMEEKGKKTKQKTHSPYRSVADRVPRLHRLPRPQQRRGVHRTRHRGRVHELERERGRSGAGEDPGQSVERVAVARVLGRERRRRSGNGSSFRFNRWSSCGESGSGGVASLCAVGGGLGGGPGGGIVRLHRFSSCSCRRRSGGSGGGRRRHRRRGDGPLWGHLLQRAQHLCREGSLLCLVEVEGDLQGQSDVVVVARAQELGQQSGERGGVVERDEAPRDSPDVGGGSDAIPAEQATSFLVELHDQPQHLVPEPPVRHQRLRDPQAVGQGPRPVRRASQGRREPVEPPGVEGHAHPLLGLAVAEAAVEEALDQGGEALVDGFRRRGRRGGGGSRNSGSAPGGDVAVDAGGQHRLGVVRARGDVEERAGAEGVAEGVVELAEVVEDLGKG